MNCVQYWLALAFISLAGVTPFEALGQDMHQNSCPLPLLVNGPDGEGPRQPQISQGWPQRSPQGTKLVFAGSQSGPLYILDLSTLKVQKIKSEQWHLPGYYCDQVAWCPYDEDRLVLAIEEVIDTPGHPSAVVGNLYFYQVSTGAVEKITPTQFPYGCPIGLVRHPFLAGSHPGSDSILVAFRVGREPKQDSLFYGVYVPQTQALIPLPRQKDRYDFGTSSDGVDTLVAYNAPKPPGSEANYQRYYVNDRRINLSPLPDSAAVVRYGTFSPNNELFALEVSPQAYQELTGLPGSFAQVWIFKTKDPSAPYKVIDFQDRLCMYSFAGIYPEFITDSTLAVSMHRDGDPSPLWEISLDGDIIRQLTMVPVASVRETAEPLDVRYTVESGAIVLKVGESSAGKVAMVNELGRKVFVDRVAGGNTEVRIPTTELAAGLYIIQVTSGNRSRSISIPFCP